MKFSKSIALLRDSFSKDLFVTDKSSSIYLFLEMLSGMTVTPVVLYKIVSKMVI
jgi:hypothetical protein